jgi:hypothetical protein
MAVTAFSGFAWRRMRAPVGLRSLRGRTQTGGGKTGPSTEKGCFYGIAADFWISMDVYVYP